VDRGKPDSQSPAGAFPPEYLAPAPWLSNDGCRPPGVRVHSGCNGRATIPPALQAGQTFRLPVVPLAGRAEA